MKNVLRPGRSATFFLMGFLVLPVTLPAQRQTPLEKMAADENRRDIDRIMKGFGTKQSQGGTGQAEYERAAKPVPCWNGTTVAWYICPLRPVDHYQGSWHQLHEGTLKAWSARTGLP